mgnify:CR=1 FL=1
MFYNMSLSLSYDKHWLLANISPQAEIWRGETPARILAEDEEEELVTVFKMFAQ